MSVLFAGVGRGHAIGGPFELPVVSQAAGRCGCPPFATLSRQTEVSATRGIAKAAREAIEPTGVESVTASSPPC